MSRTIEGLARAARDASRVCAALPGDVKDRVLIDLAAAIEKHGGDVLAANAADVAAAQAGGVDEAKLKRLRLSPSSLAQLCDGVRQIAAMPDPVNQTTRSYTVPSGLRVSKVRTPLGVIAMIYEARPGVTIDAFALCFKAGNACLLKGGREAAHSNAALAAIARGVLAGHGLPEAAVTAITTSDREELASMLRLDTLIDLVIPRGGESLIRFVHEHSRIPTVQHFHGVCHMFVDRDADAAMAAELAVTAKVSAPATCNALECLLVHTAAPPAFFAAFLARCPADLEVRGDAGFLARVGEAGLVPRSWRSAVPADFGREFLGMTLAARVVASMDEAIEHIAQFGSNHTESIITENTATAERFCREVTSSCVLVNASTRFNDGYQLGLGAEIGISTSKVHAYGPMGLEGLTIERFIAVGSGHAR